MILHCSRTLIVKGLNLGERLSKRNKKDEWERLLWCAKADIIYNIIIYISRAILMLLVHHIRISN